MQIELVVDDKLDHKLDNKLILIHNQNLDNNHFHPIFKDRDNDNNNNLVKVE